MLKPKTKKQLKKSVKHLSRHTKRVSTGIKKASRRKVAKKPVARKLMGSFQAIIISVCGLSIFFALAAIKPVPPQTYPNSEIVAASRATKEANDAAKKQSTPTPSGGANQAGTASWYALGLPAPDSHTCASTTYSRGSYLLVTNIRNGRSVICRVNDYGPQPYTKRVIDLSRGSFREIENLGAGLAPVQVRLTSPPASSIEIAKTIIGYQLCYQRFNPTYCESKRYLNLPLE